jgi:hypothetical protein
MEDVETLEITLATRSVKVNGVEVSNGEVIGLHNGELAASGDSVEEVTRHLLREVGSEDAEIITLYYGEDVSEDDAQALAGRLQEDWPDQEIEVIPGGQPHYYYIVSVE